MKYLSIFAMKAVVLHIERIASSAHNPAIQVRFKLETVKCVQVIALSVRDKALQKNTVEVLRTPVVTTPCLWWQVQLISHAVGDPLRQLLGQELQKGVAPSESIFKALFLSIVCT